MCPAAFFLSLVCCCCICADYYEQDWQTSFWGETNYPKLLAIKLKYDPNGVFTCHRCVGSEFWSKDGNCRLVKTEKSQR